MQFMMGLQKSMESLGKDQPDSGVVFTPGQFQKGQTTMPTARQVVIIIIIFSEKRIEFIRVGDAIRTTG